MKSSVSLSLKIIEILRFQNLNIHHTYSASLCLSENAVILIANGIEHVPKTLTTRKLLNRALKPSFCKQRANRRAATLASSSLVDPVQVIFPDDQMEAVVYGLRSFIVTI